MDKLRKQGVLYPIRLVEEELMLPTRPDGKEV